MSTTKGQFLELFLIDGKPGGMLTAEVLGWTGQVVENFETTCFEFFQPMFDFIKLRCPTVRLR